MLCQFERLIYPHDVSTAANGQYMVAVYNPCENVKDSTGNVVTQVRPSDTAYRQQTISVMIFKDTGAKIPNTVFSLRLKTTRKL